MQKSEPPAAEKLNYASIPPRADLPKCATYLPPIHPPGEKKQPCFRLRRGGRCGRSRSRVTAPAALHREEAGEADDEEVEGADGHFGSDVSIETRAFRNLLEMRDGKAKHRKREEST